MLERLRKQYKAHVLDWFERLKRFQIKRSLLGICVLFIVCICLICSVVLAVCWNSMLSASRKQKERETERAVSQAATSIRLELQRLEKISRILYNKSRIYFEPDLSASGSQVAGEFNQSIDQIFEANEDIPGVTIYHPNGGRLAYTNPYTPYYFSSGSRALDEKQIASRRQDVLFLRNEADSQEHSMLAVRLYEPVDREGRAMIAIEKNWGDIGEILSLLGLLENGSAVITNSQGRIIMSYRGSSSIGDIEIVRNNRLSGRLGNDPGIGHIEEYGEKKAVFFDRMPDYGCTFLYIVNEEYLAGEKPNGWPMAGAALLLVAAVTAAFLLFRRYVYLPIISIERTLDAIVNGDTNFSVPTIGEGNELYPLYSNLNLLTYRLKKLIDSEYTANMHKKQAEIDALQSQINPHFLYNTLESIRGQAMEEDMKSIADMVKALADIFRYSISKKNAMVTLGEELENIDNYLNIQQYRFEDRFVVRKEIDPESLLCLVPKLIVQPLVENAIIHGMETKEGQGTIWISTQILRDTLIIGVKDDGEGIDPEKLAVINDYLANGAPAKSRSDMRIGLALNNINERIHMIYGNQYGLRIFSMKHVGTNVELWIPKTLR